jgi:hypothetical protein
MLNLPEAIERTHRHKTPALLEGVANVVVPACLRIDSRPASVEELATLVAQSGLTFPVLMRPLATHGGERVELQASIESLWSALTAADSPHYLTSFYDFRSADGFYRKYRIIFVDGEPYPYHLAISSHWMVHYFSADMLDNPWKLREEEHFLADWITALGKRASDAIREIGRTLDLDYGGVDFTLTDDGQVLVFEANATMLTHREPPRGPLAHKNSYIERIFNAFGQMVRRSELR